MSVNGDKFLKKNFIYISSFCYIVFFNNFARYFKFLSLCASDGGLVVYEKLERNVGWRADDYFSGLFVAYIDGVEFVRFPYARENNMAYDLYYKGGNRFVSSSYEKKRSFYDSEPVYRLVIESEYIKGWPGIERFEFKFIRLKDGYLMAEYNDYHVSVFEKDDVFYISVPSFDYAGGVKGFFEDLEELF